LSVPREREWIVNIARYGLSYHTFIENQDVAVDEVLGFEVKRLALLSRKLLEDVEDASKIFVYKSRVTAPRARIDALVACLRGFGPNTLLWVTTAEAGKPSGLVEQLGDGLMRGYIDRFAIYEDSPDISVTAWETLCRKAYALWRAQPERVGAP
jgi:hypothetical protein